MPKHLHKSIFIVLCVIVICPECYISYYVKLSPCLSPFSHYFPCFPFFIIEQKGKPLPNLVRGIQILWKTQGILEILEAIHAYISDINEFDSNKIQTNWTFYTSIEYQELKHNYRQEKFSSFVIFQGLGTYENIIVTTIYNNKHRK